jgi:hypothetical protein
VFLAARQLKYPAREFGLGSLLVLFYGRSDLDFPWGRFSLARDISSKPTHDCLLPHRPRPNSANVRNQADTLAFDRSLRSP